MSAVAHPRARGALTGAGLLAGGLAAGLAIGAGTFFLHPLLFPVLAGMVIAGMLTLARPHIGLAVGLLIPPILVLGDQASGAGPLTLLWAGVLVALVWLVHHEQFAERRHAEALDLAVLAYVLMSMVAVAVAPQGGIAIYLLRGVVAGALIYVAARRLLLRREQLTFVLGAFSAAGILVGGLATFQWFSGAGSEVGFVDGSGEVIGRITANFPHPNLLGGFLVSVVPFALAGAIVDRPRRLLHLAAVVLGVVGVYVSFSRGALLALAVVPFVFLRPRQLVRGIPVIALLLALATPGLLKERFATLTDSGASSDTRPDIWRTAGSVWRENPITGVGLGEFPEAYRTSRLPGKQFAPGTNLEPPTHAHNIVLQHLAEMGIIGLAALIALMATGIRAALEVRRRPDPWSRAVGCGALGSLGAFLAHNQFDFTLIEPVDTIYLFAALGIAGAARTISRTPAS